MAAEDFLLGTARGWGQRKSIALGLYEGVEPFF